MKKEALKRIFEFLEEKEEQNPPFKWKLLNNKPLLEDDLDVKGDLYLSSTEIDSLPEDLKVKYSLFLENTTITYLPEGLKVGHNLYLYNSRINSLPKGLQVGGSLSIRHTPLEDYSDEQLREIIKPGFIKGEIYR
jgi:hypothetical protein